MAGIVVRAGKLQFLGVPMGYEYAFVTKGNSLSWLVGMDEMGELIGKWKKLGNKSAENTLSCNEIGDECCLTVQNMTAPKFQLTEMIGNHKMFKAKHGQFPNIAIKPFFAVEVNAALIRELPSRKVYNVEVKERSTGRIYVLEMEKTHNVGFGKCLIRDHFGLPDYVPVQIANLPNTSGRCNMFKALKKTLQCEKPATKAKKQVIKRPSTQTALKFTKK